MGHRRQARESATAFLYQKELEKSSVTNQPEVFAEHFKVYSNFKPYFLKLIGGVTEHQNQLDQEIQIVSEHWKLYRMQKVDLSILRLAVWEIIYELDLSEKIIIDEAVELAKIYGTEDSSKFINGVLDPIAKKWRNKNEDKTESLKSDE